MGLANVITMIALVRLGGREAFCVLILRIVLGSIFAGQIMSFMYSLAGGVMCFLIMWTAVKLINQLWVVSVLGALAHNIGQIAVAVLVTRTWQIVGYLPILAISGVVTGAFTGLSAGFVISRRASNIRRDRA
jgi:heptaprenyl diphosphate synthase